MEGKQTVERKTLGRGRQGKEVDAGEGRRRQWMLKKAGEGRRRQWVLKKAEGSGC